MTNFIWLLFAHFIGDFALQHDWIAQNKKTNPYVMLSHAFVWSGCISVALQFLGTFSLWKVLFLVVGHSFIDLWKCWYGDTKRALFYLLADQAMHMVQLLLVFLVR